MDPEAPIRRKLSKELESAFAVFEEVGLTSRDGHNIRCDLLLISKELTQAICFAVEIKSIAPAQAKIYRDTFVQAFKYVGASIDDRRLPSRVVNFSFVFHELGEFARIGDFTPANRGHLEQYWMIKGVELAFNSLNVGYIRYDEKRQIELRAGSNYFWSAKKGWTTEFRRRFKMETD